LYGKKNFVTTWVEAEKKLKESGSVALQTGGGEAWNNEVAKKLTKSLNTKVLYAGMADSYNEVDGVHKFMVEAKTNKEAKGLLSKEYD
jgi:hypothetical protein